MAVKRPWLEGLRLVPGSPVLMVQRWLLFVVAALPSLAAGIRGIGDGIADRPYFVEAPDPLPMLPLIRLVDELPGSLWDMLVLAAGVAWLGNLLLTAGAVALFGTSRDDRPLVWRTIFEAGTHALWAYLRIALVALVLAALGAAILGAITGQLQEHGRQALWTLRTRFLVQVGRGLAYPVLVDPGRSLCLVVPADRRRRPAPPRPPVVDRGAAAVVAAAVRRFGRPPSAGPGQPDGRHRRAVRLASIADRQRWAGPWCGCWSSSALSFLWHWRLRAGRLLWSSPDLIDLRAVPDTPWRLPSRLLGRLRRRPLGAPKMPGTTGA